MIANAADLLEQAPDGIVVHDGEYIVAVNAAMLRMAGAQRREQVVGQLVSLLFEHPHLKGVERQLVAGQHDVAGPQFVRERLYGVDGAVHEVEAHARLFFDGDRPAVFLVMHDVRERLASERRAQERYDALRTTDAHTDARRLAGGVAHVLNNRLQVILGFANLLTDETLTAQQQLNIEQIIRAAMEGAEVTRQLLQAAGSAWYSPESVRLDSIAQSLVQEVSATARAPAPSPVQSHIEPVPAVYVDPAHARYILSYLLSNARQATRAYGRIVLTVRPVLLSLPQLASHGQRMPSGQYATMSVQDTGVGMAAETQFRMFEPFFTTAPVGQGNGLGLSAVQGLLRQNGGYLTFVSTPGVGSTFTVWFPEAGGVASGESLESGETSHLTASILVIDQESASRSAIAHGLQRAGYRVLQSDSVTEAGEVMARVGCPSLVVIGEQAVRRPAGVIGRLRAQCPLLPLLVLGVAPRGGGEAGDRAKGELSPDADGLVARLSWPYSEYVLVSRVRALLGEGS